MHFALPEQFMRPLLTTIYDSKMMPDLNNIVVPPYARIHPQVRVCNSYENLLEYSTILAEPNLYPPPTIPNIAQYNSDTIFNPAVNFSIYEQ